MPRAELEGGADFLVVGGGVREVRGEWGGGGWGDGTGRGG